MAKRPWWKKDFAGDDNLHLLPFGHPVTFLNRKASTHNPLDINRTEQDLDKEWASETGDRLQTASISLLLVGSVSFVLVICLVLFEDKWVAKIVSKFPKHSTPENILNENEGPHAPKLVIEPKKSNNPRIEDGDADLMKKDTPDFFVQRGKHEQ